MVRADQRIRIVVDAMGGDYAPSEIVKGAVLAAEKTDVEVALVGPTDIVEAELAKYDASHLPIGCIRADEFIKEGENPALAVRRKPNASIAVAAKMMKEGEAEGLISAGPTGAIVASAIQYLGMMEGIERPVIGGAIFDPAPNTVVFDCGVNIDCKPYHLLTFAVVGSVYCKKLLNITNPTIGLLNIGAEESKGNQLTKETYRLLQRSGLNFIGNIEGNQIMSGRANVLVCDAFVGNILFKFVESLGLFKDSAGRDEKRDLGGGLIWGVNGIVRKLHGSSRAPHVAVKINHVKQAVEVDLIGAIKSELTTIIKEIKL
ncbi:MAG: phosphate acyltransferase [Dehalococcoidia bacterium]|nr:MAG: phosphate acyltransferase [Dehalococcoidia bacterium]